MINIGDTFYITSPHNNTTHLFVVISKPNESNKVLLVNITTYRTGKDTACSLQPGDHPFIKTKSIINYAEA